MAAHACCHDVDAGAAPVAARRRFKSRRPSRSTQLMKARKLRKAGASRRRSGPVASRKHVMVIRTKMEALRSLVPACGGDSDGDDGRLEELLLHAAGYIVRLQMQVRVMQVMVHALNNPPED